MHQMNEWENRGSAVIIDGWINKDFGSGEGLNDSS